MGKLLHQLSENCDCRVVGIIDPLKNKKLTKKNLSDSEVVLDFSLGSEVYQNAKMCLKYNKRVVIGATGWESDFTKIQKLIGRKKNGIVYGSNFSIGMNLFYKVVESACKAINTIPNYDVYGMEYHHNRKKDSPSGSAKSLAEIVISNIKSKNRLCVDNLNRKIEKDELHFPSVRCGDIPGTHIIGFDSEFDTIKLSHIVRNRNGFALGALKAAHFISGRVGFFHFQDIFDEILQG